ncbi:MAG: 50S ribosomal protein L18 [candidate division WOR-3 bacterium]|nr:50S ribosomal protein L18 [candidate division WOR-3 bacterium]
MDRERKEKIRIKRRKQRVRKKIFGTPTRPRLSVYRSNEHIYAQVIDDLKGHTLAQASSLDKDIRKQQEEKTLKEKSRDVGLLIAERCLNRDIKEIVFDKNRFAYHGCIKNFAEGAREGGLKF